MERLKISERNILLCGEIDEACAKEISSKIIEINGKDDDYIAELKDNCNKFGVELGKIMY